MGNSAIKHDPTLGSLFVQSSKKSYYPGDTVTGCVYLRLLKPIHAKNVELQVQGREKVFFRFRQGKGHGSTSTKHVIFNKKETIHVFSEPVVRDGDYQIPF
jgi:hypothetical protein